MPINPNDAVVVNQADGGHAHATETALHAEDKGYHKNLKPRQIQMIAIGGAIGTGLFLGAGGRLNAGGPSLVIAYAVCGFFADKGWLERPSFRMFGAPYTGYLSLLFLVSVLVMVFIDSPLTMLVTALASVLMVGGWYACRTRIREIAETREGFTGTAPVVANPTPIR